MSELAFNYQGERFIPPGEAAHWRVRRILDGQRGQLDVVRDVDGVPLIVPIEISHDEFRAAVGDQDGRYRLDALNAEKMPVDVPAAYVTVPTSAQSSDWNRRVAAWWQQALVGNRNLW